LKRVDTIARVRRAFHVQGWSVKRIVRELHVSRNTVRKILRSDETDFSYERERQPLPKTGRWKAEIERFLAANEGKPSRERLTLIRIYEELRALGYDGSYDAIRRYAKGWSKDRGAVTAEAYVPLYYAPGEAYQFDWSHEIVLLNGVTTTVKVAHVRLCHSRMMYVRAYPRETQEMVFDAHDRAFAFFGGALLVTSGDPVGVLAPLRWLGAPEALAGSVALLLSAVLGMVGVASGLRVFAAGVSVGLLGALTALLGFVLPAGGAAAILMAALVCAIGLLPLLAIRFGKLPMPPITLPTGAEAAEGFRAASPGNQSGVRERPDRARVFAAVARTEEMLTGMLVGHAVLAVTAALLLVVSGGFAGRLMVAVSAVALLLRSRLFVTIRQRVPLVVAGVVSAVVLGIALLLRLDETGLLLLAAGGLVAALVVVAAGATYSKREPGPYLGRAADILDTLMVVAVVPVACAVLGLYGRARGLVG